MRNCVVIRIIVLNSFKYWLIINGQCEFIMILLQMVLLMVLIDMMMYKLII